MSLPWKLRDQNVVAYDSTYPDFVRDFSTDIAAAGEEKLRLGTDF